MAKTDWPVKTLGDLLEVSIGGIWGNEAGEDEVDVFVYRSTELIKDGQLKEELTVRRSITTRQLDSRKLEEGDLLLEKSGGGPKTPVGRVGLVKVLPGFSVCSNFMQLMRPRKKDVLPVYLHYFLNHFHVAGHTEDLQNNSTNIRNLKTAEYMEVQIPVPPLEEQKRIVALLDAATARVTELNACYEQARTHANNLYESACRTEFDNQHLKSPLVTLPDICENLDGRRKPITKSDREAGDIPYYGASGIVDYVKGYIFDERTLLISEDGANLLARSTPIAFTADGKYWVNNHAHVVKFENTVTETYVEIFLNSIPIDNWVTGAAQPKLTQAALNRIPIPMPLLDDQKRIVGRLDSMRAKTSEMVVAYDAKLTAAKNLRQSILEAAFAGDL